MLMHPAKAASSYGQLNNELLSIRSLLPHRYFSFTMSSSSVPIQSTVIETKMIDNVLHGRFLDTEGLPQYSNGLRADPFDKEYVHLKARR